MNCEEYPKTPSDYILEYGRRGDKIEELLIENARLQLELIDPSRNAVLQPTSSTCLASVVKTLKGFSSFCLNKQTYHEHTNQLRRM